VQGLSYDFLTSISITSVLAHVSETRRREVTRVVASARASLETPTLNCASVV
jgi:hypothetical protein